MQNFIPAKLHPNVYFMWDLILQAFWRLLLWKFYFCEYTICNKISVASFNYYIFLIANLSIVESHLVWGTNHSKLHWLFYVFNFTLFILRWFVTFCCCLYQEHLLCRAKWPLCVITSSCYVISVTAWTAVCVCTHLVIAS